MIFVGIFLVLLNSSLGAGLMLVFSLGRLLILNAFKTLEEMKGSSIYIGGNLIPIEFPKYSYLRNFALLLAVGILVANGFVFAAGIGVLNMLVDLLFLKPNK